MSLPSTNISECLFRQDTEPYQNKEHPFHPKPCIDSGYKVKTKGGENVARAADCHNQEEWLNSSFFQQALLSQMYKYMSGNNSLKK